MQVAIRYFNFQISAGPEQGLVIWDPLAPRGSVERPRWGWGAAVNLLGKIFQFTGL